MRPHIDRHWRQPGYEAPDCRALARHRGFLFTPVPVSIPVKSVQNKHNPAFIVCVPVFS